MNKFDFDTPVDRRHTGSLKWDVSDNELPMWVADMDFPTAPAVRQAIEKRAAHGIFGYSILPDTWERAYIDWWKERHGVTYEKDSFIFCTGVIPAISSLVRKLTTPAEKVVVLTPVYNIFFNSILNNGRVVSECPLVFDPETLTYALDFGALERSLADPQTTLLILCNPQNPVGKIWDRETLAQIGALCVKYGVAVISDEIHCDLTDPGKDYVPFASVSEECRKISITCLAPTKAFNLAGIQTAAVTVSDTFLRHKVWRALNTDEVAEPNAFAVEAAVAAFTQGGAWLDELRAYLAANKAFAAEYIEKNIPALRAVYPEATYLMWLRCTGKAAGHSHEAAAFIRRTTGLYLTAGGVYRGDGQNFFRLNVACPRVTLADGLSRLKAGMERYESKESK
mgnify:FL=1